MEVKKRQPREREGKEEKGSRADKTAPPPYMEERLPIGKEGGAVEGRRDPPPPPPS